MSNDELRDAARLLAVTQTVRALVEHVTDGDEDEAGQIYALAKTMIESSPHASAEVTKAAVTIVREELVRPLN